ncbi:MAG: hypothetical protein IPM48_09600 [Saprospiraceae bacterium]|nr:hypothetical protein [Saprospiraceae bacterium]
MSSSTFIFQFTRFKFLLLREWNHSKSTIAIVFTSILGIMFLSLPIQLLGSESIDSPYRIESLGSSLAIMSIIFASLSFIELAKTASRQNYLAIPASPLEKLISKWTMVALVIPVSFIICFYLISLIAPWLIQLFTTREVMSETLGFGDIFEMIPSILVAQSIYILGSIWQPRYSIIKTTFSLFLLTIMIGLVSFLFFRIVFYDFFIGVLMVKDHVSIDFPFEHIVEQKWIRYLIGFIFFLTIMATSLFKLREKEL